jgi:hypothetical protein
VLLSFREVAENHAQQDEVVNARVTDWFFAIMPTPGPTDSFDALNSTVDGKRVCCRLSTNLLR